MIIRIVLGSVFAACLCVGGWRVWLALRSDEERIRDLLTRQLAQFHAADSAWVDRFDVAFRCSRPALEHSDLRALAAFLRLRELDAGTGRLRWHVEVPAESFSFVALDEEVGAAQVVFDLELSRVGADATQWELAVDAKLSRGDDGWKWVAAQTRTTRGRRPPL